MFYIYCFWLYINTIKSIFYFIIYRECVKELKYMWFASSTNGLGILNFVYRGTSLSGEPKNPHKFLFCFIQSFSSPPISWANLCDSSLTDCFSRTNIEELVMMFSISILLFLTLSFNVDVGDGDNDDVEDVGDDDGDDINILVYKIILTRQHWFYQWTLIVYKWSIQVFGVMRRFPHERIYHEISYFCLFITRCDIWQNTMR